jgi:PAS domain S-box-containing protein
MHVPLPVTLLVDANASTARYATPALTPQDTEALLRRAFSLPDGTPLSMQAAVRHALETERSHRWTVRAPDVPAEMPPRFVLAAQPMKGDEGAAVLLTLRAQAPPQSTSLPEAERAAVDAHLAPAFDDHLLGQPGLFVHRFLPDTTETFVGAAYAHLLGAPPEHIRNTRWIERIPPEERAGYLNTLQALTPENPSVFLQQSLVDASGKRRVVRWHVRGFFDAAGALSVCQAVGFDCTDQQRVEEALFAREEWLRSILENASPVLFALDRDGVFLFSEGEDLNALGLKRGELVGQSVHDMCKDFPALVRGAEAALGGERVEFVFEESGRTFNVWCAPFHRADGAVAGAVGMGVDVTHQVEAESALEKSESTYRNIINHASDAIYIQAPTGHFIDANDAAVELYGYTREEMMGLLPADVAAPGRNDMAAVRERLQ